MENTRKNRFQLNQNNDKSFQVLKQNLTKAEIEPYLKNPDLKILYSNKTAFHESLKKYDEIVYITNIQHNTFENLFYLILLINDEPIFVNYKYSLEYIEKINEFQKKEEEKYVKIILCKIIFVLIHNYKGFFEGNEDEKKKIGGNRK